MSDNTRELYGKGGTYVISRRFLPGSKHTTGRTRVRVTAYEGTRYSWSVPLWTDYRDFKDMHAGDAAYAAQIKSIQDHIDG